VLLVGSVLTEPDDAGFGRLTEGVCCGFYASLRETKQSIYKKVPFKDGFFVLY
jgi:hypothetical protein